MGNISSIPGMQVTGLRDFTSLSTGVLVYWLVTGHELSWWCLHSPHRKIIWHPECWILTFALRQELAFMHSKEVGNRVRRTERFMSEQLPLQQSILYPIRYPASTWSSLNCPPDVYGSRRRVLRVLLSYYRCLVGTSYHDTCTEICMAEMSETPNLGTVTYWLSFDRLLGKHVCNSLQFSLNQSSPWLHKHPLRCRRSFEPFVPLSLFKHQRTNQEWITKLFTGFDTVTPPGWAHSKYRTR